MEVGQARPADEDDRGKGVLGGSRPWYNGHAQLDTIEMPTILLVRGWRVFFYANEGAEPIHVHVRKAEAECKYWLYTDVFDIEAEWEYGMTPRLRREIRRIIFDHFDLIVDEWHRVFGDA